MTSFLDSRLTSQPLHLLRDRGGLGDWRWMLRFRTTTWQVPGSMGFVGSKRETKHHLWNRNLIDCCSHYPVDFLKLLRAWARESQRDTERKRWREAGRKKIQSSWSSAVQSPWSPLQLSSSSEAGRQAGSRERERTQRSSPPRTTHCAVFPRALSTLNFSHFAWSWNWIMR